MSGSNLKNVLCTYDFTQKHVQNEGGSKIKHVRSQCQILTLIVKIYHVTKIS